MRRLTEVIDAVGIAPVRVAKERLASWGLLFLAIVVFTMFASCDMSAIAYKAHYVALGEWNVYEAVLAHNPSYLENVTYPPFTYWCFGVWIRIGHVFGLFPWLGEAGAWDTPRWLHTGEALWLRLL